ncbi:MAG TPA: ketoacyl-ACP synthase III [Thermoanaerobaculia bacterium]|nr:ketoacyl-ACP synthase III [Thermoanaerobaculia bacterium]
MKFTFRDKRIRGVLTVLPPGERTFAEDMKSFDFPEAKALRLAAVMGYDRHRIADAETCVSDLAVFGMQHLFAHGFASPDEIDALILVTQSPDHLIPPTSSIIQGRLGLKRDMFCLDVNQGCAGFVVGLLQAFLLLEQESVRQVAVINADVLSRRVSPRDKNSFPLTGDAAAITLVERAETGETIHATLRMDGTRHDALMIPAGGFRMPSTAATAQLQEGAENNWRALDHLTMDGTSVFNFVQLEVPPMIEELLRDAAATREDVDAFMFHQPNRFMLEKLADKMGVPREKLPANIVENFGNASGATIPTNITFNLGSELTRRAMRLCFAGFGVGLTWASMLMRVGPLAFCDTIDFPKGPAV